MKTVSGSSLMDRFGIDYLQGASVFGALSPDAIEFLLERGRVFALEKGDVVYEPGDKGDRFYVVLQGALSFYQFHLGEFAYIRDHQFGEEMGFVAMIALHDRVGRAVAARQIGSPHAPLKEHVSDEHDARLLTVEADAPRRVARRV